MSDFFTSALSSVQKRIDQNLGIEESQANDAMGDKPPDTFPLPAGRRPAVPSLGYTPVSRDSHIRTRALQPP
jgi:hypothetical protein